MNEVKSVKWTKSPQQLIELFDDILLESEGVDKRKMFGYPCAFKHGNMFMGLHRENMFLRLSKEDREIFLELGQARQFEPIPRRVMREYVVIPTWMLKNVKELKEWITKSLSYVSSLPPKKRKKRKQGNL